MKTTFEVIIWLVIIWAVAYYGYWHLIRPAILLRLRYRIFAARDRLRMLVVSKEIGEKAPAYPIIEQRCHACLSLMEHADLLELLTVKPSTEQTLRAQKDMEIIQESTPEVRAVYMDLVQALLGGILLNSPGLVIPAAIVLVFQFWFRKFKSLLNRAEMNAWSATYVRA